MGGFQCTSLACCLGALWALEGGAFQTGAGVQAPEQGRGLKLWVIDAPTRRLEDVTDHGVIPVFGGDVPYGLCTYHSMRTGRFHAFVTGRDGKVEQYELRATAPGAIGGARVRAF